MYVCVRNMCVKDVREREMNKMRKMGILHFLVMIKRKQRSELDELDNSMMSSGG